MDNREELLQYLQKNGRCRPSKIVKSVSVPKRDVYRLLKLLTKRGQVKRECFRPKIFYSYVSGLEEVAPATDKPKAAVPAEVLVPQKSSSSPHTDSKYSYKDLSDCRHQLSKVQMALEVAQSMVRYQEKVIARIKARSDGFLHEMNRLRGELQKPKK